MSTHRDLPKTEQQRNADTCYQLGRQHFLDGDLDAADQELRQAHGWYMGLANMVGFFRVIAVMATVQQCRSDTIGQVLADREAALRVNELRMPEGVLGLAGDAYFVGKSKDVPMLCDAAITIAKQNGDQVWLAKGWLVRGDLQQCMGNAVDSAKSFEQAKRLCAQVEDPLLHGGFLQELGLYHHARKNFEHAQLRFDEALDEFLAMDEKEKAAQVLLEMASTYAALNRKEEVQRAAERALTLAGAAGAESLEVAARALLDSVA